MNAGPPQTNELAALRQRVSKLEAENARLRRGQAASAALFEQQHAVLLIIDPEDGAIVDANNAACKFYGYSRDTLQQMNIAQINTLGAEAIEIEMAQAKSEQRHHFCFAHRLASGEERLVEVYSGPVMRNGRSLLFSIVFDVTERHQTEQALKESEARYRLLADNATDVIWLLNLEGRFTYVSPSVERLRGYTPEEVLQQTMDEALTPDSLVKVLSNFQRVTEALENGEDLPPPELHELEQPCKDGSTVWTEVVSDLLFDDDHQLIGIVGVSRNITDRRRADAALRWHNRSLTLLNNVIQAANSSLDIEEILGLVCGELAETFGVPHVVVVLQTDQGDSFEIVIDQHPPGTPDVTGALIPIAGNPLVHYLIEHPVPLAISDVREMDILESVQALMRPRGTRSLLILPVVVRDTLIGAFVLGSVASRTFDASDMELAQHVAGAIGQALHNAYLFRELENHSSQLEQHIADLRVAEEALQRSQERFRMLINATQEGVLIHEKGIMVDANPAMAQMFGCTIADLIGQSVLDLVTPPSREIVRASMLSREQRWYEVDAVHTNGTVFPVEVLSRSMSSQPNAPRVAAVRDISARKQAEQHAMDLALERERVSLLHRVIGDVSHDFKTPLAGLKLSLDVLKMPVNAARHQRHLDLMASQVARLEQLLSDLLALSRLDDNAGLMCRPVDLNALIQGLLTDLQAVAAARDCHLTFNREPELPPVTLDANQIGRALTNVIVNGINYSEPGGTVRVCTRCQGDHVEICVEDNGIGIQENDLPYIFERFYRADPARNRDSGGLGVGLAIARQIIDMHDGQIAVESTPDEGSTFLVRLPFAGPAQPAPDQANPDRRVPDAESGDHAPGRQSSS